MIQFNLLPDIKQEFVKVNRLKRTVIVIAVLVSASLLVIFVLLLSWDGLQKKNLSDINRDIATNESQLTSTPNLSKILTIQNQLNSLPALEQQDPVTSRLYGYLSQITPTAATISTFNADFGQHTADLSGDADSLATIDVFADTLKFTTYTVAGKSTTGQKAFSNVVLSAFSTSGADATYTLTFDFDPALFSNANTSVTLTVPPEVTTRSVIDQPLFKQTAKPPTN